MYIYIYIYKKTYSFYVYVYMHECASRMSHVYMAMWQYMYTCEYDVFQHADNSNRVRQTTSQNNKWHTCNSCFIQFCTIFIHTYLPYPPLNKREPELHNPFAVSFHVPPRNIVVPCVENDGKYICSLS